MENIPIINPSDWAYPRWAYCRYPFDTPSHSCADPIMPIFVEEAAKEQHNSLFISY